MNKQFLVVLAGVALALAATAHAAPVVDFSKLSPQQQAHMAQVLAKKRSDIGAEYNYDIRPAVLKSISVSRQVKANLKIAEAIVSLKLADNLSGVSRVEITLLSPSGSQYAAGVWQASYEDTREDVQIALDMSDKSENGEWRVSGVSVADANGNATFYDEAALAAKGRTSFTLTGATGDFEAPNAASGGVNLTPAVSLSTPPRGMLPNNPARLGVQLKLVDVGVSGVRQASMEFCKEGSYWECFAVSGTLSARGQQAVVLTLGGLAHAYWVVPGNYMPRSLSVSDFAGNYRDLHTDYGHDLNSLLDNPVIVVTE
jgi:hypothetical protein